MANTGCYAVATILALAPLITSGIAQAHDVVVVGASGTSGAGRGLKGNLLGSEVMGDLSPYKVGVHQHVPEILQAAGAKTLTFTPVLAPLPRGILATVTARPAARVSVAEVRAVLSAAYEGEPFVHLLDEGQQPHTAATAGFELGASASCDRRELRANHRDVCDRQPRQGGCRPGRAERQPDAGAARDGWLVSRRGRPMSVTAARGFRAAGVAAGLKPSGARDVALVVNDGPSDLAAAVFTANRVKAAPVLWSQQAIADGRARAVILELRRCQRVHRTGRVRRHPPHG